MIPISSDGIRAFRSRSKWLAYLLLKSVEALHESGNQDLADLLLSADRKWVSIHQKGVDNE